VRTAAARTVRPTLRDPRAQRKFAVSGHPAARAAASHASAASTSPPAVPASPAHYLVWKMAALLRFPILNEAPAAASLVNYSLWEMVTRLQYAILNEAPAAASLVHYLLWKMVTRPCVLILIPNETDSPAAHPRRGRGSSSCLRAALASAAGFPGL
jgi:hypothetical protein